MAHTAGDWSPGCQLILNHTEGKTCRGMETFLWTHNMNVLVAVVVALSPSGMYWCKVLIIQMNELAASMKRRCNGLKYTACRNLERKTWVGVAPEADWKRQQNLMSSVMETNYVRCAAVENLEMCCRRAGLTHAAVDLMRVADSTRAVDVPSAVGVIPEFELGMTYD